MKFLSGWFQENVSVSYAEKLKAAGLAGVALWLTGWLNHYWLGGVGFTVLMASMGASAVILFAVPQSPMARPWALVGGHCVSGLVGVGCGQFITDVWLAAAAALSLSIFMMYQLRCLHPPGGATTLMPVLGGETIKALGWQFLFTPLLLNVLVMLCYMLLVKRLTAAVKPAATAAPTSAPLGLKAQDLQAALAGLDSFVDVSAQQLQNIYQLANQHALKREFAQLSCASILQPVAAAVEFGDELAHVWQIMQQQQLKVLPVVDRAQHVIGVVTQSDFFRYASCEHLESFKERWLRLLQRSPTITSDKPEVVGQIMTCPAVTASEETLLVELIPVLLEQHLRQIPVVNAQNKLTGWVRQTDLIAALYRG